MKAAFTMQPTLTLLISLSLTPLVGGATYCLAADGNDKKTAETPLRRVQVATDAPPSTRVVRDLTPLHDATRVLINPHKGWYHHFPDNHPDKYQIAHDADLVDFPGMDHLDIGSIGDWGEGHCWAGSRKALPFAVRKEHVDLHLKHFKHTQLVISDDYVHALKDPAERARLHQHILTNSISYRDDSIMVDGYFSSTSDQFTVRSPAFFADAFLQTPTVFELEHYGAVKRLGNWAALPDSSTAKFGKGKAGPDFFRGALDLLHATYIGYHGDAREWLTDNPELTKELLNRCGYWLFPKSIELPPTLAAGGRVPLTLVMENRGVAPPYASYELRVKLSGAGSQAIQVLGAGGKSWLPGAPVASGYEFSLPAELEPGEYQLAIGLFDRNASRERPVELGLKASTRDVEGFYRLMEVLVTAASALDH